MKNLIFDFIRIFAWTLFKFLQNQLGKFRILMRRGSTQLQVKELIGLFRPFDSGIPLVRIGGDDDGGYLLPDDLEEIVGCFSPGVSDIVSFEEHITDRKIPCYLIDASISSAPIESEYIFFDSVNLSSADTSTTTTLESWLNKYHKFNGDLILQMDIEGSEYECLLASSATTLTNFRIICIEFHHLDNLGDEFSLRIIKGALSKLLQDFLIVHIHPNNARPFVKWGNIEIPPTLEVTFLRKDRIKNLSSISKLPHPLDFPNVNNKPIQILPRYWWSNLA